MSKLDLEKAEAPEIKLPTSVGSSKKQESSRKTSISVLLTMPMPLTVWITTNCGKFWNRWENQPPDLPLEKSVCRSGSNSYNWTWTADWFQIGKGVCQGCILSPCFLTYMQSTSWEMLGWMKHKLESKIAKRSINNLRYADDTTLMAESEEQLKGLLMKVKEEWKSWLKAHRSQN